MAGVHPYHSVVVDMEFAFLDRMVGRTTNEEGDTFVAYVEAVFLSLKAGSHYVVLPRSIVLRVDHALNHIVWVVAHEPPTLVVHYPHYQRIRVQPEQAMDFHLAILGNCFLGLA